MCFVARPIHRSLTRFIVGGVPNKALLRARAPAAHFEHTLLARGSAERQAVMQQQYL